MRARGGRGGAIDRLDACPRGDLLHAGPLLVADRDIAYAPDVDAGGVRAAAHQFDPDEPGGRPISSALEFRPLSACRPSR